MKSTVMGVGIPGIFSILSTIIGGGAGTLLGGGMGSITGILGTALGGIGTMIGGIGLNTSILGLVLGGIGGIGGSALNLVLNVWSMVEPIIGSVVAALIGLIPII